MRILVGMAGLLLLGAGPPRSAPVAEFQPASEHCYFMPAGEGGANVGLVVTREGALMVDPPPPAELDAVVGALKGVTSAPVRWVVHTSYRRMQVSTWEKFVGQGALLIGSESLDRLASSVPAPAEPNPAGDSSAVVKTEPSALHLSAPRPPRFLFQEGFLLFPDDLEIRIMAVPSQAVTAGDVVVLVPGEKVLITGDLFAPGSFPEIDIQPGGGDPLGWIEGMKQVIGAVPLFRSAMPQPEPELPPPPLELERALEEHVTVIPGRGPASDLQEMKKLLETAQKLRAQVGRALAAKRSFKTFMESPALDEFRSFERFEAFAQLLFDAPPQK
jgi:glyoxylase-like metal-dependent hydrolase (beta-lactamase superfamily II)